MITRRPKTFGLVGYIGLLALGFLAAATADAGTINLNVVDNDGNPVEGFRWIVQEDTTFDVDPAEIQANNQPTDPNDLLSLNFHASHHPIARDAEGNGLTGNTDLASTSIGGVDAGRYYVSVLPYSGYSISGQPVKLGQGTGGTSDVTVIVQKHPVPTATITVFLFHDNYPVNGAPDLPEEENPPSDDPDHVDWTQFSIILEEPAGRYGMAGGQVIQDAYGNPLGTSYVRGCDANGQPDFDMSTNYGCLDLDGNPIIDVPGDGTLHPNADGYLTIRNLAPGKYGIVAIPPTKQAEEVVGWQQTSTIEGTKVIDAWVKANEPAFFVEFGPPGPHVFIGFIKSTEDGGFAALPAGGATISGTITDMHMSRPPNTQMFSGRPFPGCWIALNEGLAGAVGAGLYAAPCNDDSTFSIPDVAPGDYTLKVFDTNLDVVIATMGLSVNPDGINCNGLAPNGIDPAVATCEFGEIGVFNWFARLLTGVFNDVDQDGIWDADEIGIGPESQDVSLRWRDGTMYQNFPMDNGGEAPFDEVFPFFHWLVGEVSFGNKKATGATYVVDAGGVVDPTDPAFPAVGPDFPGLGELHPQAQPGLLDCDANPLAEECSNDGYSRTERGPVLTTGFAGYLGQTSVMHFGKSDYMTFSGTSFIGENGGISGIVYNSVTRAEDEPQFAAAEEWEAGVPRVQVNLYADGDIDSFPQGDFPSGVGDIDWNGNGVRDLDDDVIDDIDGDGFATLADVDNYPLGNFPGGEDIDRNGNGEFDLGDALQVTWTDSWDDDQPTGCGGNNNEGSAVYPPIDGDRCFDGLRNFNQIRPAVFDGGYAFSDYDLGHLAEASNDVDNEPLNNFPGVEDIDHNGNGVMDAGIVDDAINAYYAAATAAVTTNAGADTAAKLQLGLIPGDYIVESATPRGYGVMKEEDKNVDFGDEYIPSTQALAVACVGDEREVPPYLSMTTKDGSGAADQLIAGILPADAAAPFAGEMRPLCDRKKVPLSAAQNAAAEFFLTTDVPVAGNVSGVMLNDLANEFNPNAPSFGEKYAPPLLPIAFYDFNGKQVNRVYGDQYGRYNLMVPSTYTANLPQPSGMSPNMLLSCMNDAGPIPDGAGGFMIDPNFDPQYSQFCYTFQYMPGAITYLDTPIVPIAAFTSPGAYPLDCERPSMTPMVRLVTRTDNTGPFVVPGDSIRIESMGQVRVRNPEWDGLNLNKKHVTRDYRFGSQTGDVFLVSDANTYDLNPGNANWNQNEITVDVPETAVPGDYQVVVINADGVESPIGIMLTVGSETDMVHRVSPAPYPATPIQDAIDAAMPGELILIGPGDYDELVVMWKPVKLQGWGAGAVFINARQIPTEKITNWRAKTSALVAAGDIDVLLGQEVGVPGFPALAEALFPVEEGAGIFVAGKQEGANTFAANPGARIDGVTIVGASTGGGIVVNGYNEGLSIGNNRLTANAGFFGGGIRVGHPTLTDEEGLFYIDSLNDNIRIHHNHIAKNGGFGGAGGGISLNTGADGYQVRQNWVCGNFTQGDGAGIGHLGVSDGGLIEDNYIIFNESFAQANAQSGGGIFIGGQTPLVPGELSPGTGNVTIDSNIIRGNLAGAGDGGGLRIANANGADVADNLGDTGAWWQVDVFNNMITNNVAGLAAGGISLQDALKVNIRNNTVANNDSTATTAEAIGPFVNGQPQSSTPQPAGIVSRQHSGDLAALMLDVTAGVAADWLLFSDPALNDNIVYQNRSFYWANLDDPSTATIEAGLYPSSCGAPPGAGDPLCDVTAAAYDPADHSADLAVLGVAGTLDPFNSLLTDTTDNGAYIGTNGNITGDPAFVMGYSNGARDNLNIPEFTTLRTAGAFDEGGNFIQVDFGPLSLVVPDMNPNNQESDLRFDYHLATGSTAIDAGSITPLAVDIDDEARPIGLGSDIGADEAE